MRHKNTTHRFPFLERIIVFLVSFILITTASPGDRVRVLVFTKTSGWDHGTRSAADSVIYNLGILNGFDVDTTGESGSYFTDISLARYDAVCFINTTGTIFTNNEREAFKKYMHGGGGYVGMHASTDCEYDWSWYGRMTGANFNGHPFNVATAKVAVLDKKHPSTEFISGDTLTRTDEWYFWGPNPDFRDNPLIDPAENDSIHVLMELVESSIAGSTLKHPHPMCWYSYFEGGRVWYSGLGHEPGAFNDPLVKRMLLGGIRYAAAATASKVMPIAQDYKPFVRSASVRKPAIYDLLGREVPALPSSIRNMHCSGIRWESTEKTGNKFGTGRYFLIPEEKQ